MRTKNSWLFSFLNILANNFLPIIRALAFTGSINQLRTLLLLSALALSACNSTNQQSYKRPVETNLSPVQPMSVELAESRGTEIFSKDMFSAEATDFLLEKGLLNAQSGVLGWLTELDSVAPTTYFIGGTPENYKVIFKVQFKGGKKPELVESSEMTERLSNKFKSRQLALQSIQAPCSQNYNTVVLESPNEYIVYALAAATERNQIVVGGHYRFTYLKSDISLKSKERLSNSCLVLNNSEGSIPFATHILTDTPLDIHAYLGKLHGGFYISTKSGLYEAKEGKLRLVKK